VKGALERNVEWLGGMGGRESKETSLWDERIKEKGMERGGISQERVASGCVWVLDEASGEKKGEEENN